MYQSLSIGMLASAFVSLIFGSPVVVAGALVASGLFAVADAMRRKEHEISAENEAPDRH